MKFLFFIISLIVSTIVFSQEDEELERDKIIEKRIEFIGENLENSTIDLTTYLEDLYYFYDNPINLNQTSFDELSKLLILTDNQIYGILNYRKKYGELLSIYELTAIEELDKESISMILPFVSVKKVETDKFY